MTTDIPFPHAACTCTRAANWSAQYRRPMYVGESFAGAAAHAVVGGVIGRRVSARGGRSYIAIDGEGWTLFVDRM